jgi:hypothetical protein
MLNTNGEVPTLVGGLSTLAASVGGLQELAEQPGAETPMRTRNPPRGALLAFGAPGPGMVQFSGLWFGLRYPVESQLRYSAESQYSPTPPITADITVQPFQAAAMK